MKNNECNKYNSIILFPNGSITKCFNIFFDKKCSIYDFNKCADSKNINEIIFIINNNCNYNCSYCADNLYRNKINKNIFNFDFNKIENFITTINKEISISYSYFEPTISANFIESILFFSKFKNIKKIKICTDGIYLNQKVINILNTLKNILFEIEININFPKIIHEKYKMNSYDLILNNIKNIKCHNNIIINCETILFIDTFKNNNFDTFKKEFILYENLFSNINIYLNHYEADDIISKYSVYLNFFNLYKKVKLNKIKYNKEFIINNSYYYNTYIYYNNSKIKKDGD